MERILKYLQDLKNCPEISSATNLIQTGQLDSFDIMSLIHYLEQTYKIDILGEDIIPDNFKNIQTISEMIKRNGGKVQ